MKRCSKCQILKAEFLYYKNRASKDGLRADCKRCQNKVRDLWAKSNKEKLQKLRSEYRKRPEIKKHRALLSQAWNRKNIESTLITKAKIRARKLGLSFSLSKQDIKIPEFCPILGLKLQVSSNKVSDSSPTLDRLNGNLGYIKENVAVISHKANRIKNNSSFEELEKIYFWWKNGKYS